MSLTKSIGACYEVFAPWRNFFHTKAQSADMEERITRQWALRVLFQRSDRCTDAHRKCLRRVVHSKLRLRQAEGYVATLGDGLNL